MKTLRSAQEDLAYRNRRNRRDGRDQETLGGYLKTLKAWNVALNDDCLNVLKTEG